MSSPLASSDLPSVSEIVGMRGGPRSHQRWSYPPPSSDPPPKVGLLSSQRSSSVAAGLDPGSADLSNDGEAPHSARVPVRSSPELGTLAQARTVSSLGAFRGAGRRDAQMSSAPVLPFGTVTPPSKAQRPVDYVSGSSSPRVGETAEIPSTPCPDGTKSGKAAQRRVWSLLSAARQRQRVAASQPANASSRRNPHRACKTAPRPSEKLKPRANQRYQLRSKVYRRARAGSNSRRA